MTMSADKDMGKRNPYIASEGMTSGIGTLEITVEASQQKLRYHGVQL